MTRKSADAANICHIEPTEELRKLLGRERFAVLVENGTEPPFRNAYWNNHAEGIYLDAVDGTPLFSSRAKYDSGTGWPSFWQPIDPENLVLIEDRSLGMLRTEVRAKKSGGHLGHLFDDGPAPSGRRYCMNSASLRFIPVAELDASGLAGLLPIFEEP
jgi:methionine-R-sulfoxide reductase